MARLERAERAPLPWELRLGLRLPPPPILSGLLAAAGLCALSWLEHVAFGFPIVDPDSRAVLPLSGNAHAAFGFSLLLGYLLGAVRYVMAGITQDLERVRQAWGLAVPVPGLRRSHLAASRWIAAATVLAVVAAFAAVGERRWRELPHAPEHLPEAVWPVFLTLLFAWCVGRASYFTVRGVREITGRMARELEVDLLDPRPFTAFGRIGLRLSLAWLVGISLGFLVAFFDPNPQDAPAALPFMLFALSVASLALVVPVLGVHGRIREAKAAELERLDTALRRLRDASAAPGHRADLLAERAFVEGAREWPFDTSTLTRFALYLLIPLGSWIGGALVERFVSQLLD